MQSSSFQSEFSPTSALLLSSCHFRTSARCFVNYVRTNYLTFSPAPD